MASSAVRKFLESKRLGLKARAGRLITLTPRKVGLRPQDMPYAPSASHFEAANRRMSEIAERTVHQLARLDRTWGESDSQQKLVQMAMVEREGDRARRAY